VALVLFCTVHAADPGVEEDSVVTSAAAPDAPAHAVKSDAVADDGEADAPVEVAAKQDGAAVVEDDAPAEEDDKSNDIGEAKETAEPKAASVAPVEPVETETQPVESDKEEVSDKEAQAPDEAPDDSDAADQLADDDDSVSDKVDQNDSADEDKELGDSQQSTSKDDASTDSKPAGATLGESKTSSKAAPTLGESQTPADPSTDVIPAEVGVLGKGEAYIPLSPTIPKLTVLKEFNMKGLLTVSGQEARQFSVNSFADISSTAAGAAIFGGNMHVVTNKEKDEFRYSNTHGQIGGMGFAANYPHYNKASIVSSKTTASTVHGAFKPNVVATFTGTGDVGVGVEGPASRLHVHGDGNTRLINVNHWGDLSACASGVGLFAGNAYVSTENNEPKFRYANSHSGMGAIGFASNYPDWNTASIVTSGTASATAKQSFTPKAIASFTYDGKMGVGTSKPKSVLDVRSAGRQLSVNDWVDVSSQGSAGFIGLNAHLVLKGTARAFAFSNTQKDTGAIGLATNYPLINQMSVVASTESSSSANTVFKPHTIATFTREGKTGFGTDAPLSTFDVRHVSDRQISANKFADMSANEKMQGFFGGNGYTVGAGGEFRFANTNAIAGAVGLATHYPKPGEAAIISSGAEQPKEGLPFKPFTLAHFKSDGSMSLPKDLVVIGDLRVSGRMLNGDDEEYDFMAAQEALVQENTRLQERLSRMEAMMMALTTTK
jgi:hypothetical protein